MKTENGKEQVQRVSVPSHYEEVIAELKRIYDRPRVVVKHHLKKLAAMEKVTNTYEGIRKFYEDFSSCIDGLKANDGLTAGQIVTGLKAELLTGSSVCCRL